MQDGAKFKFQNTRGQTLVVLINRITETHSSMSQFLASESEDDRSKTTRLEERKKFKFKPSILKKIITTNLNELQVNFKSSKTDGVDFYAAVNNAEERLFESKAQKRYQKKKTMAEAQPISPLRTDAPVKRKRTKKILAPVIKEDEDPILEAKKAKKNLEELRALRPIPRTGAALQVQPKTIPNPPPTVSIIAEEPAEDVAIAHETVPLGGDATLPNDRPAIGQAFYDEIVGVTDKENLFGRAKPLGINPRDYVFNAQYSPLDLFEPPKEAKKDTICGICQIPLRQGISKDKGEPYSMCDTTTCCLEWMPPHLVGAYHVLLDEKVLPDFKPPQAPVRCIQHNALAKFVWPHRSNNPALKTAIFGVCSIKKEDNMGARCGFTICLTEKDSETARELSKQYYQDLAEMKQKIAMHAQQQRLARQQARLDIKSGTGAFAPHHKAGKN